jgi:hypothetical protein
MTQPRDPWAERTAEMPPQDNPYRRGVAPVSARRAAANPPTLPQPPIAPHAPTGTGWPGDPRAVAPPPGEEWRQIKRGRELSLVGGLFAFVCWGIWAISSGGDLRSPIALFLLTLLVAVGLFFLVRLLGKVIWVRQLGRVRRTAKGAHLATGLFLAVVGVAYLRQTEWVMSAWSWIAGRF